MSRIDVNYWGRTTRLGHAKPAAVPEGWRRIEDAKPPTYCHYSNPASQGALIAETREFPSAYNPATHEYHSAYSDRIAGWDYDRFKRACEIVGTGDQGWSDRCPQLGDAKLREFAQVALNTSTLPEYVRVIHYFNVSSGYSCPVIVALVTKAPVPQ